MLAVVSFSGLFSTRRGSCLDQIILLVLAKMFSIKMKLVLMKYCHMPDFSPAVVRIEFGLLEHTLSQEKKAKPNIYKIKYKTILADWCET